MTYRRSSADVARIILANPDGTYSLDGERIIEADGFEVGGFDAGMPGPYSLPTEATAEQLIEYNLTQRKLSERIFHLRREAQAEVHGSMPIRLGRWTDPRGRVHLDATRHVPGVQLAMSTARLLGQEAIWDWATGASLTVEERAL